jgi:hypothetical protein
LEIRYTAGWCFLAVVVFNIGVNLAGLIIPMLKLLRDKIKSKCAKKASKTVYEKPTMEMVDSYLYS